MQNLAQQRFRRLEKSEMTSCRVDTQKLYRIPNRQPSPRSNLEKHGKPQGKALWKRLRAVANRPSLKESAPREFKKAQKP
jgi:hypothetical protein